MSLVPFGHHHTVTKESVFEQRASLTIWSHKVNNSSTKTNVNDKTDDHIDNNK